MSDKKKTTMLDLSSPAFSYEAAADALNVVRDKEKNRKINLRNVNTALDIAGFYPGAAGFGADFINTILYGLQGKFGDAALSSVAMVQFVGSIVANKKKLKALQDSGEEFITFYRGVDDSVPLDKMIVELKPTPSGSKYFWDEDVPDMLHVGSDFHIPDKFGSFQPGSINPMHGIIQDKGWEQTFLGLNKAGRERSSRIVGDYFSEEGMDPFTKLMELPDYPMPNTIIHTSTVPEIAMDYVNINLKGKGTLLRYDIPVKELKRLADPTTKPHMMGGPGFLTNDKILFEQFNLGTGSYGSFTGGFKPIGDVSIFMKGIPHKYNTKIYKGTLEEIQEQLVKGGDLDDYGKFRDDFITNRDLFMEDIKGSSLQPRQGYKNFKKQLKKDFNLPKKD